MQEHLNSCNLVGNCLFVLNLFTIYLIAIDVCLLGVMDENILNE